MRPHTHIVVLYLILAVMLASFYRQYTEMCFAIAQMQAHDNSDVILGANQDSSIKRLQEETQYLMRSTNDLRTAHADIEATSRHLKEEIHQTMDRLKAIEKRHSFFDTNGVPNRSLPEKCD